MQCDEEISVSLRCFVLKEELGPSTGESTRKISMGKENAGLSQVWVQKSIHLSIFWRSGY